MFKIILMVAILPRKFFLPKMQFINVLLFILMLILDTLLRLLLIYTFYTNHKSKNDIETLITVFFC